MALVVLRHSSVLRHGTACSLHVLIYGCLIGGVAEKLLLSHLAKKLLLFRQIVVIRNGSKLALTLRVLKGSNVTFSDGRVIEVLCVTRAYGWIIFPNLHDLTRTDKILLILLH